MLTSRKMHQVVVKTIQVSAKVRVRPRNIYAWFYHNGSTRSKIITISRDIIHACLQEKYHRVKIDHRVYLSKVLLHIIIYYFTLIRIEHRVGFPYWNGCIVAGVLAANVHLRVPESQPHGCVRHVFGRHATYPVALLDTTAAYLSGHEQWGSCQGSSHPSKRRSFGLDKTNFIVLLSSLGVSLLYQRCI